MLCWPDIDASHRRLNFCAYLSYSIATILPSLWFQ